MPVTVAVVVLAAGLAVLGWRWFPHDPLAAAAPASAVPMAATPSAPTPTRAVALDTRAEDAQLHLDHADAELVRAAEQLVTARRLLAALSPELARNYLAFEKRRSDNAWSACDAAAAALEQARDDLKAAASMKKEE